MQMVNSHNLCRHYRHKSLNTAYDAVQHLTVDDPKSRGVDARRPGRKIGDRRGLETLAIIYALP